MIPVLSVKQIREIDSSTTDNLKSAGYSLMKQAAEGLVDAVKKVMQDNKSGRIAIFCGKGNNGGDGYTAGWMLKRDLYDVTCFAVCKKNELTGEALCAYNEYIENCGNVVLITDSKEVPDLSMFTLIIDALLGNGLKGEARGIYAEIIFSINRTDIPVIAADTPSGLDNDTGLPSGACVNASVTVAMGFPRTGLYFYPGRMHVGELVIQKLDYRQEIVDLNSSNTWHPEMKDLKQMMPDRHAYGSKGDHGRVLLVCGSRGMAGAAALVARAAMRTGCGMSFLAIPQSLTDILSVKLTETVLLPVAETPSGAIDLKAIDQIVDSADGKNALCIGPGMGHSLPASECVRELVRRIDLPIVLDADGLNAFRDCVDKMADHRADMVITPHQGEWIRLFGVLDSEPQKRIAQVKEIAVRYQITVLLKGSPSIVADHNGNAYILPYGNSALAKAGSGDVLSGLIVSLIAQGAAVKNAAILGAYIHGESGVIASKQLSEYSVIASDIIETVPAAIKDLLSVTDR